MNRLTGKRLATVVGFGLIGWALCGSIIGIGRSVASLDAALIAHAIGAPIVFAIVSLVYFRGFGFTTPLRTATIFVMRIAFMDVVVVGSFVERSYAMFGSVIGFWVPATLIFLATYVTGRYIGGSAIPRSV